MVISIIQPCFVPWLGYFEQIALADVFVYLDDVKYTKQDWRNNNQLKSPYGIAKIFVPVKKTKEDTLINQVEISYNEKWEQRLINQISANYGKACFFEEVMEFLRKVIFSKHERLVDLNYNLNNAILEFLGINTPIYLSSDIFKTTNDKNLRLLEICRNFDNVNVFYDGKKAKNFIDISLFKQNGVDVIFQDYQHKPYQQLWGDFVPYMSIIDLIMNHGKESLMYIINNSINKNTH
jgi:hypothetical protein